MKARQFFIDFICILIIFVTLFYGIGGMSRQKREQSNGLSSRAGNRR